MELLIAYTGISLNGKPIFDIVNTYNGIKMESVILPSPHYKTGGAHQTTLRQELIWYLEDYLSLPIDAQNTE